MPELTARMDAPTGPEIRQQVGPVQRLAESLYEVASGLRIRGHAVAASGVEEAAFAAVLWSDSPVASAVAPERPSTAPVDLPAVLSSVDDVARVAIASGLLPSDPGEAEGGPWQGHGAEVEATVFRGRLDVVYVGTRHGRMARLDDGCTGALLWHAIRSAIQAARGGESDV